MVTPAFELGDCQIMRGSRLAARENKAWVSEKGAFAFGFTPVGSSDDGLLQLGISYYQLPGDRVVVWSPNRYVSILLNECAI